MKRVHVLDISWLPKLVQFFLIQMWWFVTYPDHLRYREEYRMIRFLTHPEGKWLVIASCQDLMEKHLTFRGRKSDE
jgi:hypothetical protein